MAYEQVVLYLAEPFVCVVVGGGLLTPPPTPDCS